MLATVACWAFTGGAAAEAAKGGPESLAAAAASQERLFDVAAGAPAVDDRPGNGPGVAPAAADPAAAMATVSNAKKVQLQQDHSSGATPLPDSRNSGVDMAAKQQQQQHQ